jgi:hypothetical protein
MTREHNNGVFTTAPTWEKQSSGLWALKFVSGSSQYVTLPDIKQLLGATQATWMAWVRKDASVSNQKLMADYSTADIAANGVKWIFCGEGASNGLFGRVGIGTVAGYVDTTIASVFTTGWHFAWMRYTGNSVTGLQSGCDDTASSLISTTSVPQLGNVSNNTTHIGRINHSGATWVYSSMTLGALAISTLALSDTEIWKWGQSRRRLLGI